MSNDNFFEKFKGQIQTMGKEGIFGTLNNDNLDKKETIIYHNNFKVNRVNNLKPIKKGKTFLKPIEKQIIKENQNHSLQEKKIQIDINQNELINNIQNNQIINNPNINNQNINNPQFMIQNPYLQQFNYPIYQMNNYQQPYILNPYYNPYQNQIQIINNQNYITNNNPINNNDNNFNNQNQIQNNISNLSNNNNNTTLNNSKVNGKTKLRPISANQSKINLSNLSSGKLNSVYSNSRITNVEYKPYTLKEYKELEKVGVVLGKLGPNIGTKEWEEKKKKMQKMEEYSKKILSMKKRTKSKDKFENVIQEEKKKKIENSIRKRCYEYGNLIRPKSANIFGRKNNNNNNDNNINNNLFVNNNNKFEVDCSNKNNRTKHNIIDKNEFNDNNYDIDKPIFSLRNLNNAYVNHDNVKRYDVNNYQNRFKDFENKNNIIEDINNNKNNNIILNKNDFIEKPITNDYYNNEDEEDIVNINFTNKNDENKEKPEINSDNIEKLLEVRKQYLKNIDLIKKLYQ